jgi:hypothetical protein
MNAKDDAGLNNRSNGCECEGDGVMSLFKVVTSQGVEVGNE